MIKRVKFGAAFSCFFLANCGGQQMDHSLAGYWKQASPLQIGLEGKEDYQELSILDKGVQITRTCFENGVPALSSISYSDAEYDFEAKTIKLSSKLYNKTTVVTSDGTEKTCEVKLTKDAGILKYELDNSRLVLKGSDTPILESDPVVFKLSAKYYNP